MYDVQLRESCFAAIDDSTSPPMTVREVLSVAAIRSRHRIALKEVTAQGGIGRIWTYRELEWEVLRLAQGLLQRHAVGDRIAVWAPNCPEWVLLEYAAAYAGLVLVTLNPSLQLREAKYVLEQSGAGAIYYLPEHRGNPVGAMTQRLCAELGIYGVAMDDAAALFGSGLASQPLPVVNPRDAAQIQYTSGTTGFPKGAVLHHHGLLRNAQDCAARAGVRASDIWLNFMPMFHTAGCAISTLGALASGATLLIASYDAARMHALIERERVNVIFGVPTMITGLIEAQSAAPLDLSCVRTVISGGSMVAPELVRRTCETFPSARMVIVYGQTETSPVITAVWPDCAAEDISQTVGQPLPGVSVSIRDPKTDAVLPAGEIGEICARGYLTMLGYHENADATAKAIDADGWLHTGDLGTMDARGFLRITGRVKEMIIRGGENLFPVEIENALLEHPDLAEVAIVGLPDERWGEIVACFMRARGAARPEVPALIRFCRERLSAQKTPTVWAYVDEWPLTGSGKVRKFLLKQQYDQGLIFAVN